MGFLFWVDISVDISFFLNRILRLSNFFFSFSSQINSKNKIKILRFRLFIKFLIVAKHPCRQAQAENRSLDGDLNLGTRHSVEIIGLAGRI